MSKFNFLLLTAFFCFLFSCSDDNADPGPDPGSGLPDKMTLTGKVEKGPFVAGSSVVFHVLDHSLTATGISFPTTVLANDGSYGLDDIHFESPYVSVLATGYFYDESYGYDPDDSMITLSGLADLTQGASVNVNIWTHLMRDRVIHLATKEGKSFREASAQAQKELLSNFGLQRFAEEEASTVSLSDGSEAGSALLVVSATLLKWCYNNTPRLTQQLTNLAGQLKEKGEFSPEIREELRQESTEADWEQIAGDIVEYYASMGKELTLYDLNYFVDWDGDGIAGNELGTPGTERQLAFETELLQVPVEGGTFRVKIEANVPYKIPTLLDIDRPHYYDIGIRDMDFTYSLDTSTNELIVEIGPAPALLVNYGTAFISTYDENVSATLKIEQQGDYTKELPNEMVQYMYSVPLSYVSLGLDLSTLVEAVYSQSLLSGERWTEIYEHRLAPSNGSVYSTWFSNYQGLNDMRHMKDRFTAQLGDMALPQLAVTVQEAMLYYALGVLWENVPYIRQGELDGAQLPVEDLFAIFEPALIQSREVFPAQKNDNLLFVSRDLPTALLARMYMHTGRYQQALALWEEIISSNNYQLENSWERMLTTGNREMIYSYAPNEQTHYLTNIYNGGLIPGIGYGEVVISAAEAAYRTGNISQALNYLNQLRAARGLAQATAADFTGLLTATWKNELKGTLSYFAYLKRTGQIVDILPDGRLLPIPEQEIMQSPGLVQNPGY